MEKETFNPNFKYCHDYKVWVVNQCEVCEACASSEESSPETNEQS